MASGTGLEVTSYSASLVRKQGTDMESEDLPSVSHSSPLPTPVTLFLRKVPSGDQYFQVHEPLGTSYV